MSADRSWRCPTCARETRSSRGVRARYCARCEVWCAMAPEPLVDSLDSPWFGEPEMGMPPLQLGRQSPEVLYEAPPGAYEGFAGKRGNA